MWNVFLGSQLRRFFGATAFSIGTVTASGTSADNVGQHILLKKAP